MLKLFLQTIKSLIILSLLSLAFSCGFQVIYKERKEDNKNISYIEELAAIRVKKNRDRLSQELKNNLYDIINPDYIKTEPKYLLFLSIKESISPTYITSAGSSGRNKVTLSISYELKSLKTGSSIARGSTSVNDNYDVTSNRYASHVSENYIKSNLAQIAAQNLRNSLVNDFIETKKKCYNKEEFLKELKEKNSKNLEDDLDEYENFVCPL